MSKDKRFIMLCVVSDMGLLEYLWSYVGKGDVIAFKLFNPRSFHRWSPKICSWFKVKSNMDR